MTTTTDEIEELPVVGARVRVAFPFRWMSQKFLGHEGTVYRVSGRFIEVEFAGFGGWSFEPGELVIVRPTDGGTA